MGSVLDVQNRVDAVRRAAYEAIQEADWEAAEGLLRRLIQLNPSAGVDVWDHLGFTLLMQGDYLGCLEVLKPFASHPQRSFWVQHKLGDAYRGLNQLDDAVRSYRLSLQEGSDSPLSFRNLLQVLDRQDPRLALGELKRWRQLATGMPDAAWDGARQAALLVPGPALVQTLQSWGLADGDCRQRLLKAACYGMDIDQVCDLLREAAAQPAGLTAWEQALQERLKRLNLLPLSRSAATNGRGAASRPQPSGGD